MASICLHEVNFVNLQKETIDDFGEQWTKHPEFDGYYASLELFRDIVEPLLPVEKLEGKRVAEIGSGAGRIAAMLLNAKVERLLAIEPSDACKVLRKNLEAFGERVEILNVTGDQIPAERDLDYVLSVGVIHHIPDPDPVLKAAREALKPGGGLFIWVYGKENNRLYLFFANAIRALTTKMPHFMLQGLCWLLYFVLSAYMQFCKYVPLPMHTYLNKMLRHFSPKDIRLNIYDQLNPAYAKYYTKDEVLDLMQRNGFTNVQIYHRHNYSWAAIGLKEG